MPKLNQPTVIISIVICVIVLIAGGLWAKAKQAPQADTPPDVSAEPIVEPEPITTFGFLMPTNWAHLEKVEKNLQELTPNQVIRFGIVSDPFNADIVYFTAIAPDPDNADRILLSVYQQNTVDYAFTRLYKRAFAKGDIRGIQPEATYDFHAIGYDKGQLIILAQDNTDVITPCTEIVTLGYAGSDLAREIYSLNLADPYAHGLEAYQVPKDIYTEARTQERECLDNTF
ncbi:MAG: hypothetical protein WAZ14_00940 [Patescibacteria group bacterium]